MAETLLAILLVTTSAEESNIVFRWPTVPAPSPRLTRPRPNEASSISQFDNPWRASHFSEESELPRSFESFKLKDDSELDYTWPRPNALHDQTLSFGNSSQPSLSSVNSPTSPQGYGYDEHGVVQDEYEQVMGFSAKFLAQHLCPHRSMCHQKFELVVDDLAFIGHPVCDDPGGNWSFRPEKIKSGSRGRESREFEGSFSPHSMVASPIAEKSSQQTSTAGENEWLQTFHLVLVLDLPDPSSAASGNLGKYFNILYEEIVFTLTAVLYQEQVLSNFVEKECNTINSLKDDFVKKGQPFSQFAAQACEISSIAPAIKSLFEAIKSSSVAYITINRLPLELQLPPYLDTLLHSHAEQEAGDFIDPFDDDVTFNWGQDMNLGWKLPTVAPWKTLLLLDIDNDVDPHSTLKGPYDTPEEQNLAEGLLRFLETVSVTLSLNEMATLLDWDLEVKVYPIVKWLVLHRRAKVVDVVHPGLRTVFAITGKLSSSLSELSNDFKETFSHPSIPPLPRILSSLSLSLSKPTNNHFFASVVRSKELIPMCHEVVLWMLKRDLLLTLHLRIRIVATSELKLRVKTTRDKKLARKARKSGARVPLEYDIELDDQDLAGDGVLPTLSPSYFLPSVKMKSRSFSNRFRRVSSKDSGGSEISELNFNEDDLASGRTKDNDFGVAEDDGDSGWDTTEDHRGASIIYDPGKATPMQRKWLAAMSEGKHPDVARRFELINQYFDGKRSDDEILYRADISRKQLREVLHHYEEYLQTFLHPS